MLININGKYGARIGNIQVFTLEGAIAAYKAFAKRCYDNLTMESSVVLSEVADDMLRLGFTLAELDEMEKRVIGEEVPA